MNRVLFGSLTVLAAVLFGVVGCQDQPKTKDTPKVEPAVSLEAKPPYKPSESMTELVTRYSERQRRKHGAKMSITAETRKDQEGKPELVVHWQIDYDGPRPPFTILPPDLQLPTNWQTKLYLYYEAAGRAPQEFLIPSPSFAGRSAIHEEQFVTARSDENRVIGYNVIHPDLVRYRLESGELQTFPTDIDVETCYLQLYHRPTHRSGSLDAWTGELWSNVTRASK
jgi:hypothetical protein